MKSNPFPSAAGIDGFQNLSGSCSSRELINLYSGNLLCRYTVVNVPGLGLPLLFELVYNSQDPVMGPVGNNWRHNYLMKLQLNSASPSHVTFTSETGRPFRFDYDVATSSWKPAASSFFLPGTLTQSGSNWIMMMPRGGFLTFEPDPLDPDYPSTPTMMRLASITDVHGFAITLSWNTSGQLETITDASGNRSIQLGYDGTSGLLDSITDPNGQAAETPYATTLAYDGYQNLTTITGPELCVTTYGYGSAPTSHLLKTRTDPNSNTMTFDYMENADYADSVTPPFDSDSVLLYLWQVISVTDPDSNTITYTYDRINERTGFNENSAFNRTRLTDARSTEMHAVTWDYRFDTDGNLWRILDPLAHSQHFRWDNDQQLVWASAPFTFDQGRENPSNSTTRNAYDLRAWDSGGNLVYTTDPTGLVDHFVYDSDDPSPGVPKNLLTDVFPAQANLAVQGQWTDHYGRDGFLLCAFDDASGDRMHLPDYVDSVTGTFDRLHGVETGADYWKHRIDPRAPIAPDSHTREIGFWGESSGSSFTFDVALAAEVEDKKFNLSVYTNSADMAYIGQSFFWPPYEESISPLRYQEQFGRDVTVSVTDADGTQTFRVYNNAPGVWVTFAVHATSEQAVEVTVTGNGESVPRISALCFDGYENRRISYGYNSYGDMTSVTRYASESAAHLTTLEYNATSKLLESVRDARSNAGTSYATQFAYDSTYHDLVSVTDREANTWRMSFDPNGNLLTTQDPALYAINPSLYGMTWAYDAKNRVTSVTDALSNTTSVAYDPAGNIIEIVDANGKSMQFEYTSMNRLSTITDALSQQTVFEYDVAGNVVSVTDPRSNVTAFTVDDAGRLTAVVLPDVEPGTSTATRVQFAYDGVDRLLSVTTPNGTQSDKASINLVNALNLLKNPSAEAPDPLDDSLPEFWVGTAGYSSANRDTGTPSPGPYSGLATMRSDAGSSGRAWSQKNIPLLPGAKALASGWFMQGDNYGFHTLRARVWDESASLATASEGTTSPAALEWTHDLLRFDVNGDSQFLDAPVRCVIAANAHNLNGIWSDELGVYQLGAAVAYDRGGRPSLQQMPDGARMSTTYDRLGRAVAFLDPRGHVTSLAYDALDRVVSVTGPNGDILRFTWDENGNLSGFTDGSGNLTAYEHDREDRLVTITYPDATTEAFAFDEAGRLASSTNNRGQERTFEYDHAGRLTSVTYQTDSSTVVFDYDDVGNLISMTERNGDAVTYTLDDLYRVVAEGRTPGTGSTNPTWNHASTFDENGNRTGFNSTAASRYGIARFGQQRYRDMSWTAPDGYDSMDRLSGYRDASGSETTFAWDLESRVAGVTHPNGLVTTPTYDVMGRVVDIDTLDAEDAPVLRINNGYDIASNRNSLVVDHDTFDYVLDDSGQLIEEAANRFVERRGEHFQQGVGSGVQLDASGALSLLSFNDDFSGERMNADRWALFASSPTICDFQMKQNFGLRQPFVDNQGLAVGFPIGYTNRIYATEPWTTSNYNQTSDPYEATYDEPTVAMPYAGYGVYPQAFWVNLQHRMRLEGNFEVQVDFKDFQADGYAEVLMGLLVSDAPPAASMPDNYAFMARGVGSSHAQQYVARITEGGMPQTDVTASTTDVSGTLRIVRSDNDVAMWYFDGSDWQLLSNYPFDSLASTLYVSLFYSNYQGMGSVRWQNFTANDPSHDPIEVYETAGTYTSRVYDSGAYSSRTVDLLAVIAESDEPSGCAVSFEVAAGDCPALPTLVFGTITSASDTVTSVSSAHLAKLFVGATVAHSAFPSGTTVTAISSSSFTVSSSATASASSAPIVVDWTFVPVSELPVTGRYFRYRATLEGTGSATPVLTRVDVPYSGDLDSRLDVFEYDSSANMTLKVSDSSVAVTGTLTSSSSTVSGVSTGDIAKVFTGMRIDHTALPAGTTVSSVSTTSFVVSSSAIANASDATLIATGRVTESRRFEITGTLTSASSTVSSVSSGDIAKLSVGLPVVHAAFPAGTRVASLSTTSFTVSENATASASAALLEVVGINHLNQVMRNEVTTLDGSTVAWVFEYDASGNMTSRSDGTSTTTYEWDEDNRLTLVSLPDASTVAYTYDMAGRMLTRTSAAGTTTFEWDGMDIVREKGPDGTVTRLYVVNGNLMSFERAGETYQVHCDGLGHVRTVTVSSGDIVLSATYDAWGNTASITDDVPGGMPYRYVGAHGCRCDADTGLTYMRQRWYDAGLQRFVSRDQVGNTSNSYVYCNNRPLTLIDPEGLKPKPNDVIWFVKVVTEDAGRGRGNFVELVKRVNGVQAALRLLSRGRNIMCPNNFRLAQSIARQMAALYPGARWVMEKGRGAQQFWHFHVEVAREEGKWARLPFHIFFNAVPGIVSDFFNLLFNGTVDTPVIWDKDPSGDGTVEFGPTVFPFPGFIKLGRGKPPVANIDCDCTSA